MRTLPLVVALLLSPAASTFAQTEFRVATWNLESVGAPGTQQYLAALAILDRIGADVVAINEVASTADVPNLLSLAADAGYPHVAIPDTPPPFGAMRNAFISRQPFLTGPVINTSPSLSGDPTANDITRRVVEIVVEVPGGARPLTLATSTGNREPAMGRSSGGPSSPSA